MTMMIMTIMMMTIMMLVVGYRREVTSAGLVSWDKFKISLAMAEWEDLDIISCLKESIIPRPVQEKLLNKGKGCE